MFPISTQYLYKIIFSKNHKISIEFVPNSIHLQKISRFATGVLLDVWHYITIPRIQRRHNVNSPS
jgi:hypothetical protein